MDFARALTWTKVVVGRLSAVNRRQATAVEDLARRIERSARIPITLRNADDAELDVVDRARVAAELLGDVLVLGRYAGAQDVRRVLVAGATGAGARGRKARLEEREPVEKIGRHAGIRRAGIARVHAQSPRTSAP